MKKLQATAITKLLLMMNLRDLFLAKAGVNKQKVKHYLSIRILLTAVLFPAVIFTK